MSNLPAPKDTREAFVSFNRQPTNPGLLFERYTDTYLSDWTLESSKREKIENPKLAAIKKVVQITYNEELLQALKTRQELCFKEMRAEVFYTNPDWRFITGLGSHSPLEVGFTFHRLYGLPIIAGSSLKGLARAYAEFGLKISDDELKSVFGSQEKAGSAIFFDALPVTSPKLELDVMNPHYPDWYQKQEAPTNWQNPNPVFFLTVGKDTKFRFAVGGRGKDGAIARDNAIAWLKESLREMGVGAKTSAGYGYFSREAKPDKKEPKTPKATQQTAYQNGETEPKAKAEPAEDGSWQVILPKLADQRIKLKPKQSYSKVADGAKIRVRVVVDKNGTIQRAEEL